MQLLVFFSVQLPKMDTTFIKHDLVNKNTDAFNTFFDAVFPKCYAIAIRYSKTEQQSKDIAQRCFTASLKNFLMSTTEHYDESAFIRAYIVCVVTHLLSERTGELIADSITISPYRKNDSNTLFSSSEYYKNYTSDEVIGHIRKLNLIQQIIYNMSCIDKFTDVEIARIIDHHPLSIKSMLERAKHKLYSSIKTAI